MSYVITPDVMDPDLSGIKVNLQKRPTYLFKGTQLILEKERTLQVFHTPEVGWVIVYLTDKGKKMASCITPNMLKDIQEKHKYLIVKMRKNKPQSLSPSPGPSSPSYDGDYGTYSPSPPKPTPAKPSRIVRPLGASGRRLPSKKPKPSTSKPVPPKKKVVRKQSGCRDNDQVLRVTWSRDPETKKIRYKEVCAVSKNGNGIKRSRYISELIYNKHVAAGVDHRPLPKKRLVLPKRTDVSEYCKAYGDSYREECNKNSGNRAGIACRLTGSARRDYCTSTARDGVVRVKLYPLSERTCEQIGVRTYNYNRGPRYNRTESEAIARAARSKKRCEKKRSKGTQIGKFVAYGQPPTRRALKPREAPLVSSFF